MTGRSNGIGWTLGLGGRLEEPAAQQLVAELFRCVLAMLHSPEFEGDHRDSLIHDWAHLPIPKDRDVFERLSALGDQVACLLDPWASADAVVEAILGPSARRSLGVLRVTAGADIDLRVTVAYKGAAKGKWVERAYRPEEPHPAQWGDTTGDLFLNDNTFVSNVPAAIWRHELGGYPVVKKWLGYRQAKVRGGEPVTLEEAEHLRSIVWRLGALLALGPQLDAACDAATADAFTAEELGLRPSQG